MIEINFRILFFNYRRIWFAEKMPEIKKNDFVSLRQYSGEIPFNWNEKKFTTLITDLTLTEEEILSKIAKNTKYEIRRAEKEGVVSKQGTLKNFRTFFNNFAPSKGLKKLSFINLKLLKPYLYITQAESGNKILAMHATLIDRENSRARLLYSATINRDSADIDLNSIARANRFLHWKDILCLKKMEIKKYDWGGIANNPEDPITKGIDSFKEAFGGSPVTENNYESPNMRLIKRKIFYRNKL